MKHVFYLLRFIKSLTALAAAILLLTAGPWALTSSAHDQNDSRYLSGSWEWDAKGWRFSNQGNLTYYASSWGEYQNKSYYFNPVGYMVTGWNSIDGYWYYFNPEKGKDEGAMVTGWIYDPDYKGWFYTNSYGIMVTGWHKISGEWYYFNPQSDGSMGLMAVSRVVDGHYVDSEGRMNDA